ncbi:TMEM175 family protein [Nocardia sp. NBC_01388]|uniref:TMEM175 family protein n=1 Tax=Nocardia sp. NBC_01388 TaxID=2903596 RepID=UPI00324BE51C
MQFPRSTAETDHAEVRTRWTPARVETFSDGVMAIAITLLVLEIRLPEDGHENLLHQLLSLWPSYFAYVASFATVGVIWVCHHNFFARIQHVDSLLQWGNMLLLLCVGFLPFPTTALAHHIDGDPWNARVATAFYGVVAAVQAMAWLIMWVALRRDTTLFKPGHDAEFVRVHSRLAWIGFIAFDVIALIGLVQPIVALVLYMVALAVYAATSGGWPGAQRPQPAE